MKRTREEYINAINAFIPRAEQLARIEVEHRGLVRYDERENALCRAFHEWMDMLTIAAGLRIKVE